MANDVEYFVEDRECVTKDDLREQRLVVAVGKARGVELVPLALTVAADARPISIDGLAISWTKEALSALAKIREEARVRDPHFERNLPYASLRGFIEVALPNVSRIEPAMGLDSYGLDPSRSAPAPFVYLDGTEHDARSALRPILHDWLANFLVPQYVEPGEVPRPLRERIMDLADADGLLAFEAIHARLLPWDAGPTGTATPPDKRGFQLLVDQAARLLAGKELFRGRGPIRRIVMSHPGTQSLAELLTDPIEIAGRGSFSLVVSLELVTFPSVGQPLLRMDVHKRLWLNGLSDKTVDRRAISGTISSLHPDMAVNFHVRRKKGESGSWQWQPDNAFEALKRQLSLPLARMDGHDIARGDASTAANRVLLVHRDNIAEGEHGIKHGVPEVDKLEAFRAVCEALQPLGMAPFRNYIRLEPRHSKDHEHVSRMINAPTLLGAALEALEKGSSTDLTPQYLKTLDETSIDGLLRRHFKLGLEEIQKGHRIIEYRNVSGKTETDQSISLDDVIAANRAAVERMYPEEKPLLVILHEDGADAQLRILRSIVHLLWGEALEVLCNRLPSDVHGERYSLPGTDLTEASRTDLRREAWRPLAQQIADTQRRAFCLVMARDWYQGRDGIRRRDDRVNKPAARQALASIGAACVQYLLPPKPSRDGTVDLATFLHRAQAAMKDLISAHSGRVDSVRETVARCFGDSDLTKASMPREIIGITVVRKNSGRFRGNIGVTFLPIAVRIDVETGRCDMCCAYEGGKGLIVTPWERFADGLATVSRVSPVRLAQKRDVSQTRFMTFVDQIVSASVEDGAQPVIIIDSSNCVYLWGWLADRRLDVSKIEIGQKQWMQEAWKGARIVRVRQDLAPGIVESKEQLFATTTLDDAREKSELVADLCLDAPSSRVGLFRLESPEGKSGCVCYLSVGRKTLHMNKRGASCYRTTEAAIPYTAGGQTERADRAHNRAGLAISVLATRAPWTKQWPTPNPGVSSDFTGRFC